MASPSAADHAASDRGIPSTAMRCTTAESVASPAPIVSITGPGRSTMPVRTSRWPWCTRAPSPARRWPGRPGPDAPGVVARSESRDELVERRLEEERRVLVADLDEQRVAREPLESGQEPGAVVHHAGARIRVDHRDARGAGDGCAQLRRLVDVVEGEAARRRPGRPRPAPRGPRRRTTMRLAFAASLNSYLGSPPSRAVGHRPRRSRSGDGLATSRTRWSARYRRMRSPGSSSPSIASRVTSSPRSVSPTATLSAAPPTNSRAPDGPRSSSMRASPITTTRGLRASTPEPAAASRVGSAAVSRVIGRSPGAAVRRSRARRAGWAR